MYAIYPAIHTASMGFFHIARPTKAFWANDQIFDNAYVELAETVA